MTYIFSCIFENEGLLKVTASHVHSKCGNIWQLGNGSRWSRCHCRPV